MADHLTDVQEVRVQGPDMQAMMEMDFWQPIVVEHCSARDALAFAATCRAARLAAGLQLVLTALEHEDQSWSGRSDQYDAMLWQVLPLPPRTHTALLTCEWRDQGWGNSKGMLSAVRGGGAAPSDYQKWPAAVAAGREPAPHASEPLTLTWRAEPGETYSVWARVGGGGGHALHVAGLRLRCLVCEPGHPLAAA